MTEKFKPSSIEEAEAFQSKWCNWCTKDDLLNGSVTMEECRDANFCKIVGASECLEEDDPLYPDELTYDDAGNPSCTAFEPIRGAPIRRCPFTTDIFEEFSDSEGAA